MIKIKTKKGIFSGVGFLLLSAFFAYVPKFAQAGMWDTFVTSAESIAARIVIFFCRIINALCGLLLSWVGSLLNMVLRQSDQILQFEGVVEGWKFVRDVTNMFFIIVLLVIAFATILRVENYQYKQLLPKLILAIILVNFSRTICMLFIEFGDVLMRGFLNIQGDGKISQAFATEIGIGGLFKLDEVPVDKSVNKPLTVMFGYIYATIFFILFTIAIGLITAMMIVRGVALAILLIISPIVFLMNVLPATKSYAGQWWNSFAKYVMLGPIMALFIAISLMIVRGLPSSNVFKFSEETKTQSFAADEKYASAVNNKLVYSDSLNSIDEMFTYVIALAFLFGTVIAAQTLGGSAGSVVVGGFKSGLAGAAGVSGRFMKNRMGAFGKGTMSRIARSKYSPIGGLLRRFDSAVARGKMSDSWLARGAAHVADVPAKLAKGVRTLPYLHQGWKNRQARREGELDALRAGEAEDFWNYVRSVGMEKTTYGSRAFTNQIKAKKSEILDKDSSSLQRGYLNAASGSAEKAAYLMRLAETLNINDLMNNPKLMKEAGFSSAMEQAAREAGFANYADMRDKGGMYSPETLRALIRLNFGETEMGKRLAADIGETLGDVGQPNFYGLSTFNASKGKFEYTTPEVHEAIIKDKIRKVTARKFGASLHSNIFMEGEDGRLRGISRISKYTLDMCPAGTANRMNEIRGDFMDGCAQSSGYKAQNGQVLSNTENYVAQRMRDLDKNVTGSVAQKLDRELSRVQASGNESEIQRVQKEINELPQQVVNSISLVTAAQTARTGQRPVVHLDNTGKVARVEYVATPDAIKRSDWDQHVISMLGTNGFDTSRFRQAPPNP